jgi:hypothetical protein
MMMYFHKTFVLFLLIIERKFSQTGNGKTKKKEAFIFLIAGIKRQLKNQSPHK